jgi:transposase
MRRVLNQAANAAARTKGSIFEIVYRRSVPRLGHVHFTPTYASWLNQVEIWFNRITQQSIRRGTFSQRERTRGENRRLRSELQRQRSALCLDRNGRFDLRHSAKTM